MLPRQQNRRPQPLFPHKDKQLNNYMSEPCKSSKITLKTSATQWNKNLRISPPKGKKNSYILYAHPIPRTALFSAKKEIFGLKELPSLGKGELGSWVGNQPFGALHKISTLVSSYPETNKVKTSRNS